MSKTAKTVAATREMCAGALESFTEMQEMLDLYKKVSGDTKKKNSFWALVVRAFGRYSEADRNEFVDDFVAHLDTEGFERLQSFFLLDKFDAMLPLLQIADAEIDSASLTIDILSGIPREKVPKAQKLAAKLSDLYVVGDDDEDSDESIEDKSGAKMFLVDILAQKLEIAVFGEEEAEKLLQKRKKSAEEEERKQKEQTKKDKKDKKRKKREDDGEDDGESSKKSPKKTKSSASPKNTVKRKREGEGEEEQTDEKSEVVTQQDSGSE